MNIETFSAINALARILSLILFAAVLYRQIWVVRGLLDKPVEPPTRERIKEIRWTMLTIVSFLMVDNIIPILVFLQRWQAGSIDTNLTLWAATLSSAIRVFVPALLLIIYYRRRS